ncbi:MAG TPA: thioesterase domain-containing protein, partial [Verrucomicrobiae bacterium]|nr:thioesterase domain-containing protein [Verrucomicrobiae bacterium]
ADVREVFAQRIEMPLRREHIAARRLNWKPKSENLKSLARELKLGLDSFIFIDDNPVECAEVSANCPDVLTLQLPDDPAAFENFFRHCWVFDHLKLTEEDRKRAEMYQQNRQREQLREESLSLADFVAGLELRVVIEPMQPAQLQRTAQLTQRTNQFNFTTRRRTEMDIQKLLTSHEVLTVTVADRFGDYGLTGAIICSQREGTLDVDTFLLSCRVLGRGVEHQMMARLGEIAQSRKLNWVDAHFVPTQRNQPALDFLESIGAPFRQPSNGGYLFRFPAGFAAEVTFNPQPAEEAHPSPEKAVNSIAENGGDGKAPLSNRSSQPATALSGSNTAAAQPLLSGFRRCREIALNACDAGRIHQQVESRAEKRAGNRSTYVAPSNDTERQLCELWQKLLHVERVGVRDNFFELGGHSLLAVRLFAEIEKLTGRKLPLVTLFQSSTIRQLARALRKDAGEVSRGLLVPLQPNGTRPPLFLVHGAGGDVLWGYANLSAHMPADQPLFGIRSRGQTGQDEFQSIEEMAACYIKEIRGAQPQGPYHLGGYCFGGNVAYEMARQLKAQGQEVALVALLDSAPSNVGYESIQWWSPKFHLRFARNLIYWLTDFARLDTREQRRWVCRKLRAAGRKAWRLVRREEPEFFVDLEDVIDPEHFPQNELKLWQAHLEALVRHIEQPYSGEVVLLRTRGQPIFCSLEEDFCWGKLAGRLRLKRIPGSHENIFMEPNVKRLARELCACLEETRAQGARAESSLLVSKPS